MKKIRKILLVSMAAVIILTISACGKKTENTDYTSEEIGLYKTTAVNGISYVVNEDGRKSETYSFDDEGNITARNTVVVKAENVKEYKYVTAIVSLNDTANLEATLVQQLKAGSISELETAPAIYEYKVYISPSDAMNPKIRVTSSNTSVAEIESGAGGTVNADSSVTYIPTEGVVTVYVRCLKAGSAIINLSAEDMSGISLTFNVEVKNQVTEVKEENYTTLIETTESTKGWITGNNVRFREQPDQNSVVLSFYNTSKELLILGTNEEGWTKCQIDGKVGYVKSEYVTRIEIVNVTPTPTSVAVNARATATSAPTATAVIASNDGLDHGYAYGSQTEQKINSAYSTAESESHIHYYTKYQVVEPTKTKQGYTVYKCECGASYKTNYKDY